MSVAQPWDSERASARIAELQSLPGALLPILHALQHDFGYVDANAVPLIASALNISEAEVHGVISFYHDFHTEPRGRHTMKICRAESCQAMGCDKVIASVEHKTGVSLGQTTDDGALTIEPVYCLGNCALSPAMMVDGRPYGRVTPEVAEFLVDSVRRAN